MAEQTYEQIIKFKKYLTDPSPRVQLVIGGINAKEQSEEMNKGVRPFIQFQPYLLFDQVDIVVATPGRLDDMIYTKTIVLSRCRFFILDECDGLLSSGCGPLISKLHSLCPKVTPDGKRLQMIVCSATLHNFDVKKLAVSISLFT